MASRHAPSTLGVVRYLSPAWLREAGREVTASEALAELAHTHTLGVTQVITGPLDGDVVYHLSLADGVASFGPGVARPEHVRMEQTWATAVAVATGELNAQQAFITGRIRLAGDPTVLVEHQPVFAALDAALATIRPSTAY